MELTDCEIPTDHVEVPSVLSEYDHNNIYTCYGKIVCKYFTQLMYLVINENKFTDFHFRLSFCLNNNNSKQNSIRDIFHKNTYINQKNELGWTALMLACVNYPHKTSIETIEFLLENGADVNANNNKGNTALAIVCYFADKHDYTPVAKLLLKFGAKINTRSSINNTPLISTIKYFKNDFSLAMIDFLLEEGSDVNVINLDGHSPLSLAIEHKSINKKLDLVKLLLINGAYANTRTNLCWTPLLYLARTSKQDDNLDLIKLLLDFNANINATVDDDNWNALMLLVLVVAGTNYHGNIETIKLLIIRGIDMYAKEKHGFTIIDYITNNIRNGLDLEILDIICQHVNFDNKVINREILFDCCKNKSRYTLDIIKTLVKYGANINQLDVNGFPVIHTAVKHSKPDIIKFFLTANNINDLRGDLTPLMSMALCIPGIIYDVMNPNPDIPALNIRDYTANVNFLIENGADINFQNACGKTALIIAAETNNIVMIKLLLSYRANYLIEDSTGKIFLDVINHSHLKECMNIINLIEHTKLCKSNIIKDIQRLSDTTYLRPNSIRMKLYEIKWNIDRGTVLKSVKFTNLEFLAYLGVHDEYDLITKTLSHLKYID